jgi:hypothetical protein
MATSTWLIKLAPMFFKPALCKRGGLPKVSRQSVFGLLACLFLAPVTAAPLDALLTAIPEHSSPKGYVEVGTDQMNERLDIFRLRAKDPLTAGTKAGDYSGTHLNGAYRVSEAGWLSASLWQRSVSDAADTFNYTSWQIGGLYRWMEATGHQPAIGIRVSAWGNYAAQTESTTPVTVPGAILNTVKITSPADRQLQADLIGTWSLSPSMDMSMLIGGGSTKLSYGGLSATNTLNGCDYQLKFIGNAISGTLAAPCNTGVYLIDIFDDSGRFGVDVANEIAWRGQFVQAGFNTVWRSGPWTATGAYLFYAVRRKSVDAILASRNGPVFSRNHSVTLEAQYRFHPNLSGYARSQFSSNLFFNELPVSYNTSTSGRFGSKYSLFSVGLRFNF